MASAVSTYCWSSGPSISATSSRNPSAPGAASGAKNRAMRSNSPRGCAATAAFQVAGAQHMRDAVEHAVDEARLLAGEEGVGDVEILADDDARLHVGPRQQLVGAGAPHGAQHGLEPLERPVCGERARERAVAIRLAV